MLTLFLNNLALEITVDLPADKFIDRWFGEPIRAIIVPTSIFITNKKGYPALSPSHQACIRKFFSVCKYIHDGFVKFSIFLFLIILIA